jgi:HPt (histidine-containing phosphotransfer) domain-containing protein
MAVAEPLLLDLSFLYTLAENDTNYIYEVVSLYLNNVSAGLEKLEKYITEANDHEVIQRQAHALKSSAGIIKVRDMYENLVAIEAAARDKQPVSSMAASLANILKNFEEALPLIEAEKKKNRP